jgi:hypothetical protein
MMDILILDFPSGSTLPYLFSPRSPPTAARRIHSASYISRLCLMAVGSLHAMHRGWKVG